MAATHLLLVVIAAIALTIFAERRNVQAPLLLAAVGLAASMVPGIPEVRLDPHVILSLLLPPLLYSSALEFSFFSFMKRVGSILNLGVFLVVATTVAGGAVLGTLLPGISLPLAFVIAATVAPPDAVSAVAIGRKLGLPGGMMTILKGESLINDAAALTLFSAAVAAATGGSLRISNGTLFFLYSAIAALVIGIVFAAFVHLVRKRLDNPSLVTALAILTPFAVYGLAETVYASGVVAVVFAGFTLGHKAGEMPYAGRMQEREVWRVADTLLEAFAFAYMGLQFRFAISQADASGYSPTVLAIASAALLTTIVGVRVVWVFGAAGLKKIRRSGPIAGKLSVRHRESDLDWKQNLVLSWTGMRGVVTLAAAGGVPLTLAGGGHLSGSDAVVPIAFVVAMATLLLHGLTLPWLIRSLEIDSSVDERARTVERRNARAVLNQAAETVLDRMEADDWSAAELKFARMMVQRMRRAYDDAPAAEPDGGGSPDADRTLSAASMILAAQRAALIRERDEERIDDEVVREMLMSIDLEEAVIFSRREQIGNARSA